jgi:hypothetical protein
MVSMIERAGTESPLPGPGEGGELSEPGEGGESADLRFLN